MYPRTYSKTSFHGRMFSLSCYTLRLESSRNWPTKGTTFSLFTGNDERKNSKSKNTSTKVEKKKTRRIEICVLYHRYLYLPRLKVAVTSTYLYNEKKRSYESATTKKIQQRRTSLIAKELKKKAKEENSSSFNEEQTLTARLYKNKPKLILLCKHRKKKSYFRT